MTNKILGFALACAFAGAVPAQAGNVINGCDLNEASLRDIVFPMLDGNWTVDNGVGTVFKNSVDQGSYMQPVVEQQAVFSTQNGSLRIQADEFGDLPVTLPGAERASQGILGDHLEYKATQLLAGMPGVMDYASMSTSPACSPETLQVVQFGSTYEDLSGQYWFGMWLHVVSENELAGYMMMHVKGTSEIGDEFFGRRFVTMKRNH